VTPGKDSLNTLVAESSARDYDTELGCLSRRMSFNDDGLVPVAHGLGLLFLRFGLIVFFVIQPLLDHEPRSMFAAQRCNPLHKQS
jgi:hypothetical protein